jgi:hypothetical protein
MHALLKTIQSETIWWVGGEKSEKTKHKYCDLEGSLQAATKQNDTEQKNKKTSRISADWPRIYFYSCDERILIP